MSAFKASRRMFLSGQGTTEIVSVIVNAFPMQLEQVSASIAALHGAEVRGRSELGKLVVVLEAPTQGGIGELMNAITDLPGVLSAAMVFQATHEAEV